MLFARILGTIDIIVGLSILFNYAVPGAAVLFVVMLGKGIMSMFADNIGRLYGAIDIIGGFIILFNVNTGAGFSIALFLFFMYKGFVSLLPRYA